MQKMLGTLAVPQCVKDGCRACCNCTLYTSDGASEHESSEDDDVEYFRQEVGAEPEKGGI